MFKGLFARLKAIARRLTGRRPAPARPAVRHVVPFSAPHTPQPGEAARAPDTLVARVAARTTRLELPYEELVARHAAEQAAASNGGLSGPLDRPAPKAWLSALLEDHGMAPTPGRGAVGPGTGGLSGGGPSVAGPANPRPPGSRVALVELAGKGSPEVFAALRAFPPGLLPPGLPAQRELVHACFDAGKLHLLQRLAAEPLFPYACRIWKLGDQAANLEVAQALHDRFGRLMGSIFDFDPAPLAAGPGLQQQLHACYDETTGQLYLSVRHLMGPLAGFMEAMAHQQAHCFQHALIRRLAAHDDRLSDAQRTLATQWTQDFARWRTTCQAMPIGYHAVDLGRSVGLLFEAMGVEERRNPSGPTPA